MKTILSALFLLLIAISAQAQLSSSTSYETTSSSKGFRVSILKPAYKMELKNEYRTALGKQKAKATESLDNTLGIGFGIANLPVSQIGYTGQISYLQIEDKSKATGEKIKVGMVRLDGNVAWAFTNVFHMKGGLNFSNLVDIEKDSKANKWGLGIGPQAGVGFQITPNFGIDLMATATSYSVDNKDSNGEKFNSDLTFTALEIGLTGTF